MSISPIPRLGPERVNEAVIIGEDVETRLAIYVAIPLAAVAFITLLVVLLCMRKEQVAIRERRQTIDIEEGVRDNENWESIVPPRRISANTTHGGVMFPSGTVKPVGLEAIPQTSILPRGYSNEAFESSGIPGTSGAIINTRQEAMLPKSYQAKVRPVGQAFPIIMSSPQAMTHENGSQSIGSGFNQHMKIQRRSKSDVQSHTIDHIVNRKQPDRSFSLANSLDTSPAFQRLKYGTNATNSRRRSNTHQTATPSPVRYTGTEVQLSNYKTLLTDLNCGVNEKNGGHTRSPAFSKYNTLDITPRAIRRSHRIREAEQEWARENYLTTGRSKRKHKFTLRRQSRNSVSTVAGTLGNVGSKSIEDLPKSLYASNISLNSISKKRSSRILNPSPYKLQVQNSIRPNRRIEYRDGFRRKKSSTIIGRSLRRKTNRLSTELELNVIESPSFYMGFDTPLPPPLSGIEERPAKRVNGGATVMHSPSLNNTDMYPHNRRTSRTPTSSTASEGRKLKAAGRALSMKSEHAYAEIEPKDDTQKEGC